LRSKSRFKETISEVKVKKKKCMYVYVYVCIQGAPELRLQTVNLISPSSSGRI
jgi:hypothetical protein